MKRILILKGKYNFYCKVKDTDSIIFHSHPSGYLDIKFSEDCSVCEITSSKDPALKKQYSDVEVIPGNITISISDFKKYFLSSVLYIFVNLLFKDVLKYLFITLPLYLIQYIKNQPMGLKQNTVIKENLGVVFFNLIFYQSLVYDYIFVLSIILGLDKFFIRFSILFIFKIYSFIINTLLELLGLFGNKTYNRVKKRYDTIALSVDQVIIGVLIFSIFLLTYINIILYYLFYVLMYAIYQGLKIMDTFYLNLNNGKLRNISFRAKCKIIKINIGWKDILLGRIRF